MRVLTCWRGQPPLQPRAWSPATRSRSRAIHPRGRRCASVRYRRRGSLVAPLRRGTSPAIPDRRVHDRAEAPSRRSGGAPHPRYPIDRPGRCRAACTAAALEESRRWVQHLAEGGGAIEWVASACPGRRLIRSFVMGRLCLHLHRHRQRALRSCPCRSCPPRLSRRRRVHDRALAGATRRGPFRAGHITSGRSIAAAGTTGRDGGPAEVRVSAGSRRRS